MKASDTLCLDRGVVAPSFVDVVTGERRPFHMRHNTLSYMAAEAVAAAFGGDPAYIPARIGFIYGSADSLVDEDPQITRAQTWEGLYSEMHEKGQDIQIVNFSYPPTLGGEPHSASDSSSSSDSPSASSLQYEPGDYTNILPTGSNAITFHAVSNSMDAGFYGTDAFKTTDVIYQGVLLGYVPRENKYYVIARASLKGRDTWLQKPAGFEVALDWTVVFH